MNYLLDTHVILWWLTEPKKIIPRTRKMIADKKNRIFLSSISFWEMGIKQGLGRLTLPANISDTLISEGFEMLPLTYREALAVSDLPSIHQDPFDRMLIVQAKFHDLVLITHDKTIAEYPVITLTA